MIRIVELVSEVQSRVKLMGHQVKIFPDLMITISDVDPIDVHQKVYGKTTRMESLWVMNTVNPNSPFSSLKIVVESSRMNSPLVNSNLNFSIGPLRFRDLHQQFCNESREQDALFSRAHYA